MNSFLHLLAKDLIQKYSYNFDNLTILFPNKRAGLFLIGLVKFDDKSQFFGFFQSGLAFYEFA